MPKQINAFDTLKIAGFFQSFGEFSNTQIPKLSATFSFKMMSLCHSLRKCHKLMILPLPLYTPADLFTCILIKISLKLVWFFTWVTAIKLHYSDARYIIIKMLESYQDWKQFSAHTNYCYTAFFSEMFAWFMSMKFQTKESSFGGDLRRQIFKVTEIWLQF